MTTKQYQLVCKIEKSFDVTGRLFGRQGLILNDVLRRAKNNKRRIKMRERWIMSQIDTSLESI
jgi:hypothetical protein